CERSQASQVNNNRAGRYRGQAENGRGHKPGIKQEKSAEVRIRQGRQRISQTGTGMQVTRYRGPWKKHTPRHRLQVWPSLKYTCNQPQVSWLIAWLSL
ncbi:unnamed protein product, partial [Staurois parvus]